MYNLTVRQMLSTDSKRVAQIHTLSWQHAYKGVVPQAFLDDIDVDKRESNWRSGIEKDPSLIRLVAVAENNILGFVCGLHNRDKNINEIDGELWAIYVDPDRSNDEVGTTLFESFKNELMKSNIFTMNVWVLEENLSARSFYEKVGGKLSSHTKEIEIGGKKLKEISYEYFFKS